MSNLYYRIGRGTYIWFLLILSSCIGDKLIPSDFVEVTTQSPQPLGIGSLQMAGNVKRTLPEAGEIKDHGFVWAANWDGDNKDFVKNHPQTKTIPLGLLTKNEFKDTIVGLEANQTVYHYRAYVTTPEGNTVYGTVERFTFNFIVQTDTITSKFNDEVTVSAVLLGLEALKDSVIDRGHILDKDTANLYLHKSFFRKTSLKSSNDDGVFNSAFKKLAFNTLYYAKAYAKTKDGNIVYSTKVLPIKIGDGWLRVKDMPRGRAHIIAGTIANQAYVSLGCIDEDCLLTKNETTTQTHRYEPLNDTLGRWTQVQEFNGVSSTGAVSFTLNNRLYTGLGNLGGGLYYKEIWVFEPDPNGGYWRFADIFPGNGRDGAVAFVINNKAYIGTGGVIDQNQNETLTNDFYEYDPSAAQGMRWRNIAALPAKTSNSVVEKDLGRKNATTFVINGTAYVGTGTTLTGDLKDFWAYDPQRDQWTLTEAFPGDPRRDAIGFSLNGKGYIGMGYLVENSTYLADLWEFNPNGAVGKKWRSRTPLLGGGRSSAASFVIGNKAYVGGGRSITIKNNELKFILYSDFWMYTPENN